MCDEWMPVLSLAMTPEQFCQLPRHAAYRYEYCDGQAHVTPRPKHYHAWLDLTANRAEEKAPGVRVQPMRRDDLPELHDTFAAAFRRVQPFGGLNDAQLHQAARSCLERTVTGGDGPWIETASFIAHDAETVVVGAVFITLLPDGNPCSWDSYGWSGEPPADAIRHRLGRPHLTWIFVVPGAAGQGTGSALMTAAAQSLREMGFRELVSTFLRGNDSSALWHWRYGFQLLMYPSSLRRDRGQKKS